jgi:hypothetical protein
MVKVSGVPYEVDLPDMVSELERENFMLRARTERLEEELRNTDELLTKLNIELINERNNNASRKP